jgi:predicted nucleic acid-binding protein
MVKRAKPLVVCDTNIFLNYLYEQRAGKPDQTTQELVSIGFERLTISHVTFAEVFSRTKQKEVRSTTKLLNNFSQIPLSTEISHRFKAMVVAYKNFHSSVSDCLIAATTIVINAQLFTLNRKDFTYYKDLTLYNPVYS